MAKSKFNPWYVLGASLVLGVSLIAFSGNTTDGIGARNKNLQRYNLKKYLFEIDSKKGKRFVVIIANTNAEALGIVIKLDGVTALRFKQSKPIIYRNEREIFKAGQIYEGTNIFEN